MISSLIRLLKAKLDYKPTYERDDIWSFNKDDIYIDCGANVGQEIERVFETGCTVYAFEPNIHAFKVLKERFGKYKNIHLYNKAVLDKNTALKLYSHENSDEDEVMWSTGSSLMESKGNVRKDKFYEVEVIDLAEFIKDLNKRVKLLKIDVEGVEHKILNKLINTGVYRNIDLIVAETHEDRIPEIKEEITNLKNRIKKNKIKNIKLDWI